MLKKVFGHLSENKFLTAQLTLGTLAWSLVMLKSGHVYSFGMGFWGANGHDGIWHVALINSLSRATLQMPVFAGSYIKNYHIGFDLIVAAVHKITSIPVISLYFQIVPPIIAFLIGLLAYKFVYIWKKSKIQALVAVFFIYFSGSFGWVVTYLRTGSFDGESLFWSQQALSTLINPPYALSLVIIFFGLYYLAKENGSLPKNRTIIILSLLFGILAQIKIYAAVLILSALFFAGVWGFFKRGSNSFLIIFLIASAVSLFVILPTYNFTGAGLIFQPFWFLESMVSDPDRLFWPRMASALYNYKITGNIVKETLAYGLSFAIFLVGNLGIRIISFPYLGRKILAFKKLETLEIMIFSVILLGLFIPMFFIQKGNSWNSIQFFYYSLVFLSLVTGLSVGEYLENMLKRRLRKDQYVGKSKVVLIVVVIVLFCVPTTIATLRHYLPSRPPSMISNEELTALYFLRSLPDGVTLTFPFDRDYANYINPPPPKPLYLYESTAYVSALSNKISYLEDEVNLEITGYPWKERVEEIYNNFGNVSYLRSIGINYLYIPDFKNFSHKDEMQPLTIYNKDNIAIYKL
ncbi:MAG: hypothetical protein UT39_C0007G0015 [Candidatus Woesebacteria bacterium GW2011_GWA1_39_21]|uniref:Glycosyltransferase RgtA/B/C/D-like domain-containing protein n=1 Tax=Candidatus Woesebacteria bacterium GW2011_GWA1_39_21 TaxID=1618550 RepID=A0A0G0QM25_9BACT|nr:MAG: hypothetical protein UT39_C0007G0015 [Candidatus Woesebacteria bacterium GW2011_GWA1_39_21]